MEVYRLWKEWLDRVPFDERSYKVQADFSENTLTFDDWWQTHQHLFNETAYKPKGNATAKRISQIEKALAVFDAEQVYKKQRLLNYSLYQVGIDAGIDEENTPKPNDGEILAKKKLAKLSANTARLLKTAECIKYYVAIGVFPKTTYDKGDEPVVHKRPPRIHDWLIR